jgi:ABC-type branched-subunit amino acid transport system ATPase component
MTASPCLVLDNVSRQFGGLKAVDGVNLTVHAGERRAVIGPNGAGKTTLFNVISGEVPATAGRILWFGDDVTALPPHRRAMLGMARTFQVTRFFPNLTVRENVLLACAPPAGRAFTMHRPLSSCGDLAARASHLLGDFGLTHLSGEEARTLSHGDQRKLEVALSMAGRPRLLLLDEPMAGLSSNESDSMQRLLDTLDPSTAVLLIEHDMDMAFRFAQQVTVLAQGRVLAEGDKDQIRANRGVQDVYLGTPAGAR